MYGYPWEIFMKTVICFIGNIIFSLKKRKEIPKAPKKILLVKSGAIGDVLMTTPFLRELRKLFPKAQINYLVGNWSKEVLNNNKNIDNVISFDEDIIFKNKFFAILGLAKKIQKQKYDMCFVLDRSYLADIFAYLCKIPLRIGFDRKGEGFSLTHKVKTEKNKHHINEYLKLLTFFNIKPKNKEMNLFVTKKDTGLTNRFLKKNKLSKKIIGVAPLGAINPGQKMLTRRWPIRKYKELIKTLANKYGIILFGGKEERNELEQIKNELDNGVVNAAGLTIQQSSALMKKCKLFITHDSGAMHIAAASKIPVLSIFGPSNPHEKAPLNKNSRFIWKKIECAPCLKDNKFPDCKTIGCMETISVEEVLNKVKEML